MSRHFLALLGRVFENIAYAFVTRTVKITPTEGKIFYQVIDFKFNERHANKRTKATS